MRPFPCRESLPPKPTQTRPAAAQAEGLKIVFSCVRPRFWFLRAMGMGNARCSPVFSSRIAPCVSRFRCVKKGAARPMRFLRAVRISPFVSVRKIIPRRPRLRRRPQRPCDGSSGRGVLLPCQRRSRQRR